MITELCLSYVTQAAKCDLQYKESLEKPIEREVLALTKASQTDSLHLRIQSEPELS